MMTELIVAFGLMTAILTVVIVSVVRQTIGADMRRQKVLTKGEPRTARILGWQQTGQRMGPNDILRFTLAVLPGAGGPEFQTTATRCVVPMEAPQFQTGMQRPVRFLQDGKRLLVELV